MNSIVKYISCFEMATVPVNAEKPLEMSLLMPYSIKAALVQ